MWFFLYAGVALAGYGDAVDGLPSYGERELHLWTNAVRVAPEAFSADYAQAGCAYENFKSSEKSPKAPLLWHLDLNDAARFHSEDMRSHNHFSHDSYDGTSFSERVQRFYPHGQIGENIAWGYPDPYAAVTRGWMCSSGHRANIMNGSYLELGTGMDGAYYTQNFGARSGTPEQAIAMGVHTPSSPGDQVTLYADFFDGSGDKPIKYIVMLNGEQHDMRLAYGEPGMGVYSVTADVHEGACYTYYFRALSADNTESRFPETGSYGWGPCWYTDEDARWVDMQWVEEDDGKKRLQFACNGLAVAPIGGAVWLMSLGILVARRRV